jgi:two-component system, cell cycle sensor histidine kinase and response regulator CckA
VAHDFNNLLAVILNCASFVAGVIAGDESVRADVERIRSAAQQAAEFTHQLMIFGGRDRAEPEALDLGAVVADVQSLLVRSIGEHIKLVVRRAAGLPVVRADRSQIE